MIATPDDLKVSDVLELKAKQMLVVNPEYQRGGDLGRTKATA
jgi:hypothetical protein